MRRSTAIQKQHSQLNKLSINNLIRHSKGNIYGGKEEREFYGRKLKVIREESNVTQKEMAEKLNCTPSVISKLEKGDVVDIERYAELYALRLKYLDFEEKPELDSNSKNYNKALAKKYKEELEQFFDNYINISTYAIPDTNAIENNPRIIEELLGGDKPKYHKVFVPDIVITELEYRKKIPHYASGKGNCQSSKLNQ